MIGVVKRVPPVEKVRLRKLTAANGAVYVGIEVEYHPTGGEARRLQLGLAPDDAAALGAHQGQIGEKLRSSEH